MRIVLTAVAADGCWLAALLVFYWPLTEGQTNFQAGSSFSATCVAIFMMLHLEDACLMPAIHCRMQMYSIFVVVVLCFVLSIDSLLLFLRCLCELCADGFLLLSIASHRIASRLGLAFGFVGLTWRIRNFYSMVKVELESDEKQKKNNCAYYSDIFI